MPKILVYSPIDADTENVVNPLKEVGYIVSQTDNLENFFNIAADFCADIVIL